MPTADVQQQNAPSAAPEQDLTIPCARPPIIIIGMHRSGTAMVTQLLGRLGFFAGAALQADHEALYFLQANDLLLQNVNGSWDNPSPFLAFLREPRAVYMSAACLRGDLLSPAARRFLGIRRFVRYGSISAYDLPWGWKDPRSTFTLPLWLKLFPTAKLVHIVRNGVDVASSLMVREQRLLAARLGKFEQRYGRHSTRPRLQRAGYRGSARCLQRDGAFALWEEYVARAEQVLADVPNERLALRYEDFLAKPAAHLRELAGFCGLDVTDTAQIEAAASAVDATRAHAFAADSPMRDFYQSVSRTRWMLHYGYADLKM